MAPTIDFLSRHRLPCHPAPLTPHTPRHDRPPAAASGSVPSRIRSVTPLARRGGLRLSASTSRRKPHTGRHAPSSTPPPIDAPAPPGYALPAWHGRCLGGGSAGRIVPALVTNYVRRAGDGFGLNNVFALLTRCLASLRSAKQLSPQPPGRGRSGLASRSACIEAHPARGLPASRARPDPPRPPGSHPCSPGTPPAARPRPSRPLKHPPGGGALPCRPMAGPRAKPKGRAPLRGGFTQNGGDAAAAACTTALPRSAAPGQGILCTDGRSCACTRVCPSKLGNGRKKKASQILLTNRIHHM